MNLSSKLLLLSCMFGGSVFVANMQLSSIIENKVSASMESHNKNATVKFYGKPEVSVLTGTFAINDLKLDIGEMEHLKGVSLNVDGINYYNYYKGGNIFGNELKIELNNIISNNNVLSDNKIELEKTPESLKLYGTTFTYMKDDKHRNFTQEVYFELKDTGELYPKLMTTLNEVITKNKFDIPKDFNQTLLGVYNTLIVENLNFKLNNKNLLVDFMYDQMSLSDKSIKSRQDIIDRSLTSIDQTPFIIDEEHKKTLKNLFTEKDADISLRLNNKNNIKAKDIVQKMMFSSNYEKTLSDYYNFELK